MTITNLQGEGVATGGGGGYNIVISPLHPNLGTNRTPNAFEDLKQRIIGNDW